MNTANEEWMQNEMQACPRAQACCDLRFCWFGTDTKPVAQRHSVVHQLLP